MTERAYITLRCHCRAADCPGWAQVHDDAGAIAYFEKLFGGPSPTPAAPALGECLDCGAQTGQAHAQRCPDYAAAAAA